MGVLPCVSVIAESRQICLISWLHKVLWNCYFLMKLFSEQATFSELYSFRASTKDPYFSKQLYFFARATFSEDAFYWNSQFSTANLVFTATLFIYHLEINTRVFRFKLLGVHRVVHHSQNLSIK